MRSARKIMYRKGICSIYFQGKDVDYAKLLRDASDGWMLHKRAATWHEGRATVLPDQSAKKLRGFVEYERLAMPYRDVDERLGDYDEVLAKLDKTERGELLNTQVRSSRWLLADRSLTSRLR